MDHVFHLTAILVVMMDEIGLISSLWVVSEPPEALPSSFNVNPLFTTVTYAISQPLWTLLFSAFKKPAWQPYLSAHIIQILISIHSMAGTYSSRSLSDRLMKGDKLGIISASKSARSEAGARPSINVYAIYLLPTQTAAILHAAILIWIKNSRNPVAMYKASNGSVVVVYVVFNEFYNYLWCTVTGRAWCFRCGRYLRSQLYHLALLLLLRLCVRTVLRLDMLPALALVRMGLSELGL